MKIIICTRDLTFGGVGTYLKELIKEFDKNKDIERVLIIGPEKLSGFSNKIRFNILKNFGSYFITREPYFTFFCERRLRKILRKEKFDVIYIRLPLLLFKKFRIPLIPIFPELHKSISRECMRRNYFFKILGVFHYFYSYFDYKTIQNAEKIVFVSKKALNEAKKYYPKYKDKFIHIPTQVNPFEFYPLGQTTKKILKRKYNLKNNTRYILFVGRLEPLKGILMLIEVIEELRKKINIELLIAGEGILEKRIKSYNFIKYLGKVPHKELNEIYNIADLFILPSYYENCPLTILEAMASGCLILASDVGDIKNMVGNDKLVFDLRSRNQFKNKIFELLNLSKKERNKIIRALIKRAKEKYSTKIISKKILDLYKNAEEE